MTRLTGCCPDCGHTWGVHGLGGCGAVCDCKRVEPSLAEVVYGDKNPHAGYLLEGYDPI